MRQSASPRFTWPARPPPSKGMGESPPRAGSRFRVRRSPRREGGKVRITLDGIELAAVPLELRRVLTQPAVALRGIGERRGELTAALGGSHPPRNAHTTPALELVRHRRRP